MNTPNEHSQPIVIKDQELYAQLLAIELLYSSPKNEPDKEVDVKQPFFSLHLDDSRDTVLQHLRAFADKSTNPYNYPNTVDDSESDKIDFLHHTGHFIGMHSFYFDSPYSQADGSTGLGSVDSFVGFYPDQQTEENRSQVFVSLIEFFNATFGEYQRSHAAEGTMFSWTFTENDHPAEYYLLFYSDEKMAEFEAHKEQMPFIPQMKFGYQYTSN